MGLMDKYSQVIDDIEIIEVQGQVTRLIGLIVESQGPPCSIGTLCFIQLQNQKKLLAEVVGFNQDKILLMPLGQLAGISLGDKVISLNYSLRVGVGKSLLGKILDGLGRVVNSNEPYIPEELRDVVASPPDPFTRPRIISALPTGVRTIDGFLTLGQGQRVGIFAGSGVGKSVLLGMIARNSTADVNVICLTGERGREVNDFLEKDLGREGLAKSVVVVATSDRPAIVRVKSGLVAMTIAEYFRDRGLKVMFMMDSVTRIAIALREIGLAIGEPPTTKAYTPSVFAFLPQLLERAGNAPRGSITGVFTVLVEGSDMEDPIADSVRSILDGHIVLTRKLAERKHFPAIDILQSVSRLMPEITSDKHSDSAAKLSRAMAEYTNSEDLINIGAYVKGSNPVLDDAVKINPELTQFLRQNYSETTSFEKSIAMLNELGSKIGG